MITAIEKINPEDPYLNINTIERAATVLRKGGLVAFPTETVYGLGANALDNNAVKKVYEAKGRPSDNPLIVHISCFESLEQVVTDITPKATSLMEAFWPGPLTIVFNKKDIIPFQTSGGLNTIGVRFPSNKIAQLLIKKTGTVIAAPSANSSGKPSPTRASHVQFDLSDKVDMILDGGSCLYGLESTIIDMTTSLPCILRPGSVTKEMIEKVIGEVAIDSSVSNLSTLGKPKAPGMKYTHYSPLAKVTIISGEIDKVVSKINSLVYEENTRKIGILASDETKSFYNENKALVLSVGSRNDLNIIASNLFKILRNFDFYGVDVVYTESFSENDVGLAIMNRLVKSAGYNIIYVS